MDRKKSYPDVVGHLKAVKTGLKYLVAKPRMTLMYPDEMIDLPDGYRGMIVLNRKKCIGCWMCARICPANAIKMHKVEGKKRNPGINYQRCIFCGFCVDICPVGALSTSKVHDIAFYRLEEQKLGPDKMTIDPGSFRIPKGRKEPKLVKSRLDEIRGVIHE